MKKIWVAAAVLNLVTALIHTIAGHFELVLPFVQTDFVPFLKAILHACWHMVTVTLFISSAVFFYIGLRPAHDFGIPMAKLLGTLYIAFSIVFALVGLRYHLFLFQILLLLPIGMMAIYGALHNRHEAAA